MTAVLQAHGLGKHYGRVRGRGRGLGRGRSERNWALADCTLDIPAGHVVGLVGPNGAGKSTLLNLASGQMEPTAGTIEVVGGRPGSSPEQLAKVGFVAQGTPTYAGLSVADHLRLGAKLNPGWDAALADERVDRLGLDPARPAGKLSGGQRSQLALTLGIAKRPELLILDEPVAALDPLARREFLQGLMEAAVDQELSVLLSSHLVADLERLCDYLIVLVDARVRLVGEVDELLASHHRLTGPRRDPLRMPSDQQVVTASHTDRQSTLVVRADGPILDPAWEVSQLSLEDLVLAYMSPGDTSPPSRRASSSNSGNGGNGGRSGDDPPTTARAGGVRPELRVQR